MGTLSANRFIEIAKKLFNLRKRNLPISENTKSAKTAFLISRIFGPIPLLLFLWFLTAVKSGIGFWKALIVYPIILIITLLVPVLITSLIIAQKKSDIEWTRLEDRKRYLLPIVFLSTTTLCMLTFFLTNTTIFRLSLLFSGIIILMGAIWVIFNFKISGHMVVATLAISGLNLFSDQRFLWLYFLLIPLAWSRHKLRVHTWSELFGGVILTCICMLTALIVFGWPNLK